MTRKRIVALVSFAAVCAFACNASADDAWGLRVAAGFGVTGDYKDYQLEQKPRMLGVGASLRLNRYLDATLDVNHVAYGRLLPGVAWAPELKPSVSETSSMLAGMIGLELRPPNATAHGPYLSAGMGLGRFSRGEVPVVEMNGSGYTLPGTYVSGPAFSIGAGLRAPAVFNIANLRLGFQSITVASRDRWTTVVPVSAAIEIRP